MIFIVKSFKLFAFKQPEAFAELSEAKIINSCAIEVFFTMHSRAKEQEKEENWMQKDSFLANKKN